MIPQDLSPEKIPNKKGEEESVQSSFDNWKMSLWSGRVGGQNARRLRGAPALVKKDNLLLRPGRSAQTRTHPFFALRGSGF